MASELVPGALSPVKWEKAFEGAFYIFRTTFWRAIPPTPDYLAMGYIATKGYLPTASPSQPPANIAALFRDVHKRALTPFTGETTPVHRVPAPCDKHKTVGVVYSLDGRFSLADTVLPNEGDLYKFDPKKVTEESSS